MPGCWPCPRRCASLRRETRFHPAQRSSRAGASCSRSPPCWPHREDSFFAWGRRLFTAPDGSETPIPETPVVSPPWLGSLLGLLALGVGLASLAAALLLLFAERLAEWWNRRSRLWTAEPLLEAVDESLDDLASEPDARVAIIKCYRRVAPRAARARGA